jgi:hypothetical protein
MNIPEFADDVDHMLFSVANRLERLAERTGDPSLERASKIVGGQRDSVRRHMTETQRGLTPN